MAMRLLGLDPGLRRTGWGVIETDGTALVHVASGAIRPPEAGPMAARLAQLHEELARVVAAFAPTSCAIEESFVNRNAASALKLGHARGVAMLAPAAAGLAVAEYAATVVKKSLVGNGHATKEQVQAMVRMLLPGAAPESADAADALAVAICHAHHVATARRLAAAGFAA